MSMNRAIRRILAVLSVLMLAAGMAGAEKAGAALTDMTLELGNSRIVYPVVSGMADEPLQQEINTRIQEDLDVNGYLERMTLLLAEENLGIRVTWDGAVTGEVLSCVMSAEGALQNSRSTHRWTWSNIDLRDGHEITFGELFTNEESARATLEEYLDFDVAPELSAHLGNSEVTPLPGTSEAWRGATMASRSSPASTVKPRLSTACTGSSPPPWQASTRGMECSAAVLFSTSSGRNSYQVFR